MAPTSDYVIPAEEREFPDWTGFVIHAVERDGTGRLVRLLIVPGDERVNDQCEMFTREYLIEATVDRKLFIAEIYEESELK